MFSVRGDDDDLRTGPGGRATGRRPWRLLAAVIGLVAAFLAWAALFEIEEVTRAPGRVVPSAQVQGVQSLEGGVVAAIEVREGAEVRTGQPLIRLDETRALATLGELERRQQALSLELLRLQAETSGAGHLAVPDDLRANPPALAAETAVFEMRRQQLALELGVLRDRLAQREAEVAELAAQRQRAEAMAVPLRQEVALAEGLHLRNALTEVEILRLRGRLAEAEGDIAVLAAAETRAAAGVAEVRSQIRSLAVRGEMAARERLPVVLADLAVVEESLSAARDRVRQTVLRAPRRGIVNKLHVTHAGGVIQPGMVVAEIVPLDDGLMIEASVSPRDIAFVRVGAAASVKITAYDYLRYGDLPATVERLGASTLDAADGTAYFQVMLRTKRNALGDGAGTLEILPGMVAQVDIQSGRRTVLAYLVQPVLRVRHEALRER